MTPSSPLTYALGENGLCAIAATPTRDRREIAQDLLRPCERLLGVDHPFSPAQRCQEAFERSFVGERSMVAEELDAVERVSLGEQGQKPPPEQAREHPDRHEEARP